MARYLLLLTAMLVHLPICGVSAVEQPKQASNLQAGLSDHETTQQQDKQLLEKNEMQLGSLAPDIELRSLNDFQLSPVVRLSSLFKEKPVVMFMGSCTCNLTRDRVPQMNELYKELKDQAHFAFVYMKEAHPKPTKAVEVGSKKVRLTQPKTWSHRLDLTKYLIEKTGLKLPVYVDDMKGSARKAYSSYHLAAYIINSDGEFAFLKQYRYEVDDVRTALKEALKNSTKEITKRRQPTHANVSYGPDERNVLDVFQVESDQPTPLVVFFHGGGWRKGSKENLNFKLVGPSLDNGISVAAANYRLTDQASHPAQLHDSARAIQFLRSKATEWNIDPTRIAAFGGSAGGSISLWLAFHDDMADPKSADPVARHSSRLRCAFAYGGQSTNDPRVIREIIPGRAYNEGALKPLFGLPADWDWDTMEVSEELSAKLNDASPITHLTKDDPPIFLYNNNIFCEPGNIHHPNFSFYLKKQMDALNIECINEIDTDRTKAFTTFMQRQFGM